MTDQNQTPEQQPLTIDNEKLNTARTLAEEYISRKKAVIKALRNYEERPNDITLWHYQEAFTKRNAALDAFLKLYDWQDNLRIIQALLRDDYPLTLEILQEWGADTQTGLKRCLDNPEFYLKICDHVLKDISAKFISIHTRLDAGETGYAYEETKGVRLLASNPGLIPIEKPLSALRKLKESFRGDYYYSSFPFFFEKEDLPYLAKAEYELIRLLTLGSETVSTITN